MQRLLKMMNKTKSGVASFYIVAFSTLILVVIAASFAMVIVSEMTRTANDDLSKSAYDSALSGTEDAKMAYVSYTRCKEQGVKAPKLLTGGSNVTCEDIMYWVENPDCYMVGHILGKIPKGEIAEVELGTKTGQSGISINQAYTCAEIKKELPDTLLTLDSNHNMVVLKGQVASANGDGQINDVEKIRIKWSTVKNDANLNFLNAGAGSRTLNQVTFAKLASGVMLPMPPTLEVRIVQTGPTFSMSDFDLTESNATNRATLYLVPAPSNWNYTSRDNSNYFSVNNFNEIPVTQVVQTNDRAATKKPFLIKCDGVDIAADYYCEAIIDLPKVIGGGVRNNDTFAVAVSLPYQKPDTDISIELWCGKSTACAQKSADEGVSIGDDTTKAAILVNSQITVDVTGRANDLFRRVETRLNTADTTFNAGHPFYTLQVLGKDGLQKNMTVTSEYNFNF